MKYLDINTKYVFILIHAKNRIIKKDQPNAGAHYVPIVGTGIADSKHEKITENREITLPLPLQMQI